MVDYTQQINNKNDFNEALSGLQQVFGKVLENECQERLVSENRTSARAAIDDLLRQMESLSHINMEATPGTQDQQIEQRAQTAVVIKDLLLGVAEVRKGTKMRTGATQFSLDLLKAIYLGSEIFAAIKREEGTLYQFLPVTPAPAAPMAVAAEPFEEIVIDSRSMK